MKKMIAENSAYSCVSELGSNSNLYSNTFNRKMALKRIGIVILAAVLIFIFAACAVKISITWIECNNENDGTLDVSFDVTGVSDNNSEFVHRYPKTPEGFEIVSSTEELLSTMVEYRNGDTVIYYDQSGGLNGMNWSLNNENNHFENTTINGNKGYIAYSYEDEYVYIFWADGISTFYLTINSTDASILKEMAKSLE